MADLDTAPPHFELVTTEQRHPWGSAAAPQLTRIVTRWHVRLIGANGEQISRTEDYNDRGTAVIAFRLHARAIVAAYAEHDHVTDALVEVDERG